MKKRHLFLLAAGVLWSANAAAQPPLPWLVKDSSSPHWGEVRRGAELAPALPNAPPSPSLPPTGGGSEPLTLAQAQAIALEHYPQIAAAEAAIKSAKQAVKVSRSYYLPQVTGSAVRAYAQNNTRLAALPGSLSNSLVLSRGAAGVEVSQLITDFGHTVDLIASSKLELEAQKARGALTKDTVLLDATRAYFNLLRAQALLKVAQTTVDARKTFLEQVTSLRNAKLKSNLDMSIADQLKGEADLLLLKAQSGVEDAQATLSEALGYSGPRSFTLTDDTKITPPSANLDALAHQAMQQNPELAALQAESNAASRRAEAEKEAQYPTVSALGYAGATPISDPGQPISSHSLVGGINISVPFYTGGRLSAQAHEAAEQANIAAQNFITFKNQLLRDVRIAFGDVLTAYKNIGVSQELVKSANDALDLTQARYQIGSSSIVDLSQAQLAQTQAELEDTNATYQYLISRAELDYKTGSLIADKKD